MGDDVKEFLVTNNDGTVDKIFAGNVSFTMTGDLIFEDALRQFQKSYSKEYWRTVEIVKRDN